MYCDLCKGKLILIDGNNIQYLCSNPDCRKLKILMPNNKLIEGKLTENEYVNKLETSGIDSTSARLKFKQEKANRDQKNRELKQAIKLSDYLKLLMQRKEMAFKLLSKTEQEEDLFILKLKEYVNDERYNEAETLFYNYFK